MICSRVSHILKEMNMQKIKNAISKYILMHPVLVGIDGILTIIFFLWFVSYLTH